MSGFNNRPNVGQRLLDNAAGNISGVFSTKSSARYASGARTILKINGKVSAFAFGVSWKINTQVTEIQTIDDYFPYELAPQRISVEGTISALHIPGQSAGTELWQPDMLNFLFQQYVTIEVRDISDQLLFYTTQAMITSRSEDIKVDALSNVQLSWRAIGFKDERKPELAVGADKAKEADSGGAGPKAPSSRKAPSPLGPLGDFPGLGGLSIKR
jgi:hypothetical protein